MNHVDLFSGISPFAIAAQECWGEEYVNLGHSEIEKFPCKVYHKHFPESKCLGDITKIDWSEYAGRVDLLTGGFPCQPFSVAGKRKGKEDDRWLWPEMLRAIREVRPSWIIGENVGGFVQMVQFDRILEVDNEGNALGKIGDVVHRVGRFVADEALEALEAEGYTVEPFIIPACAVNAPHRRDRIWIIAFNDSIQQSDRREPRDDGGAAKKEGIQERNNLQRTRLSNKVSSHWQESWYEVATRLCRMDDGTPGELHAIRNTRLCDLDADGRRVLERTIAKGQRVARLKSLGNAIVWQVVFEIMKSIKTQM